MPSVIDDKARTTLSPEYITRRLEPVLGTKFQYSWLKPDSFWNIHFKPYYIISDRKVISVLRGVTKEVETINSLITIGNIIFKDGRDISPDESVAMHSYIKKKYTKIIK